ncbi:MAG: WD40/YVTN/BNR-like repeat-containing protein, partial [Bacteroidales bacterium]
MKKISVLVFFAFLSGMGFSQWTWLNPLPQGNTLQSVFFSNAGTGYAVGECGTILKTIDGGTSWSARTGGTNAELNSVFFTDVNTGYVVGSRGTILK